MKMFIAMAILLLAMGSAQAECLYLGNLDECMHEAKNGNPIAQYILGTHYENGEGVAQDYTEAKNWYHKAAEQGDRDAQYRLGLLYQHGRGILKDTTRAYMWFEVASVNGLPAALEEKSMLAGEMTPAEIGKAENMATDWLIANPAEAGDQ